MSERDPFDHLGELIDQPVAPNPRFAADLKTQLMSGLSAGSRLQEEEHFSMEAVLRRPVVLEPERRQRFRPAVLLGAAALLALVIGIAAVWAIGDFRSSPDSPTIIPAASFQENTEGTPIASTSPEDSLATPVVTLNDPTDVYAGWQMELPPDESLDYGGMAAAGGAVYRLLATPSFVGVEAVDGPTATVLWRSEKSWRNFGIVADDGVFFFSAPSELTALEPENGEERWVVGWEEERQAVSLAMSEGLLYVWDATGSLAAIDAATGAILWTTPTGDDSSAQVRGSETTTPVVGGDWVAVVTGAGNLTVFERTTGQILQAIPGFDPINSRLTAQFPVVFVLGDQQNPGADGANLHGTGVNVETGEIIWELEISGPLFPPIATNEENFYFIANDVEAGEGAAVGTPIVISDDSAPWSGETPEELTGGEWVYGIDAFTGEVVWQQITRSDGFIGLVTIFPNSGALSAYTADGHVVGLARDYGGISHDPKDLDRALLDVVSGGSPAFGYFATALDGTLIWFGAVPADQQG